MLAVAILTVCEGRSVTVMDIGGAFLNADSTITGRKVHMRLSRVATGLFIHIEPKHARFVAERGTSVVMFDKDLYGCVKAIILWRANPCTTMRGDGFAPNPYDPCVFNKQGSDSAKVAVLMHVDVLFITSKNIHNKARFEKCLRNKYNEIKIHIGKVADYIGMTFDLIIPAQRSVYNYGQL